MRRLLVILYSASLVKSDGSMMKSWTVRDEVYDIYTVLILNDLNICEEFFLVDTSSFKVG